MISRERKSMYRRMRARILVKAIYVDISSVISARLHRILPRAPPLTVVLETYRGFDNFIRVCRVSENEDIANTA